MHGTYIGDKFSTKKLEKDVPFSLTRSYVSNFVISSHLATTPVLTFFIAVLPSSHLESKSTNIALFTTRLLLRLLSNLVFPPVLPSPSSSRQVTHPLLFLQAHMVSSLMEMMMKL